MKRERSQKMWCALSTMINCGPKWRNINTVSQTYASHVLHWFQKQDCYYSAWNSLWFWIVTTIMTFQWYSVIWLIVRFFSVYLECKCWLNWIKMKISVCCCSAAVSEHHIYPAAITADVEVLNLDMASVGLYVLVDVKTLWFLISFVFPPVWHLFGSELLIKTTHVHVILSLLSLGPILPYVLAKPIKVTWRFCSSYASARRELLAKLN